VNQVATSIQLLPQTPSLNQGATQLFGAIEVDENGEPMNNQPAFIWSATGDGTIDASGNFTAGNSVGTATITVKTGGLSATTQVGVGGAATSPCDVNGDGVTNVVDVQLEVNEAEGTALCTNDINKDGQCNVIDVQRVINAALGGQCVSS
jgi:hypothetical protein